MQWKWIVSYFSMTWKLSFKQTDGQQSDPITVPFYFLWSKKPKIFFIANSQITKMYYVKNYLNFLAI